MMTLVVIAIVLGAFFFGSEIGKEVLKKDLTSQRRIKIHNAFSMDSYDSRNKFHNAYGLNGIYYSDVDPDNQAPLVIIQSSDLARLIAIKEIASYNLTNDELNDHKIEKRRTEIANNYLRETGMSNDTIEFLSEIFKDDGKDK